MKIGKHIIKDSSQTFFIADIAANHDGSLQRAKELIRMAKRAGADAAKFQHFSAESIVSRHGFESLTTNLSHQAKWQKTPYEVYEEASLPENWTQELFDECHRVGITFLSTPYSFQHVDDLSPFVSSYKIGSGDIDWLELINYIASQGRPVLLAAGASTMSEVGAAVEVIRRHGVPFALLQCNTNYTGSADNVRYVNLNVLRTFREVWPDAVLGLSDHTKDPEVVVGAVALGARIVERHFTDDPERPGPDHGFSLDPEQWHDMVQRVRLVEVALGNGEKVVEANESGSIIVQRRCIRAATDMRSGHVLARADLEVLRPAPPGALSPSAIAATVGAKLTRDVRRGDALHESDIDGG